MRAGALFLAACLLPVLESRGAGTNAPSVRLSVEKAVLTGLEKNRELRIQKYGPLFAGAFEQIERGIYDPEFYAGATQFEENSVETARATESQFQVEGRRTDGSTGIRQFLPTGTELAFEVASERSISSRSPEQQTARLGLSLTQQLLEGMGPAVNLAAIRQAELDTEASRYQLRGYVENLVADIEITYWRYVAAREAINVVQSSLEVAQTQLGEVESRIEVGDLPQNEGAAARAEVALRNQNLIEAQSLLAEQQFVLLRLVDPDRLGADLPSIDAVSKPDSDLDFDPDRGECLELALLCRPEIREAELRIKRGSLETVLTRNGRLPRLELFINLGKTGYADTFRESFADLDGPGYDVRIGVEFSQLLGNRSARARDTLAQLNLQEAEEALRNLRDLVRQDVLMAMNELERSRKQISASSETSGYREQTLQAERDRFEVGAATALDVALAQRDLVESQINEIEARVAYQIARIRLFLAEGSLLERRGISVESF